MEVLECPFFAERKEERIECLAITQNGYFCATAQKGGSITIFDTITFHSWLKISGTEQYSLRNLFFLKKAPSGPDIQDLQTKNGNLPLQEEYLSDSSSDDSQTTACTSPNKSPQRKSFTHVTDNHNAFDLHSYRLIGLGLDGRVVEWDLNTGMTLEVAFSYGGAIFQGSISPSNERLALACADGSIKLFSLINCELTYLYSLPKHTNRLLSVAFLNENTVFAGSCDGVILEYNLKTRICGNKMSVSTGKKSMPKYKSMNVSIWCIICLESENILFSGDSNGTVIVWDLVTYTAINTFRHHQGDVLTLSKFANMCFNSSEICIVSTGTDGRVVSYINAGNSNPRRLSKWLPGSFCYPHDSCIGSVATVPFSKSKAPIALSGTWDGKLILWLSLERSKVRKNHENPLSSTSRFKYIILPRGILTNPPTMHAAEKERLILYQGPLSLELWFVSDPNSGTNSQAASNEFLINPFQVNYEKLNHIRSGIMESNNKFQNFIPVQPIKLLEIKFSDATHGNINCCALSPDGNYILGSFSNSGVKALHIDLQNLNVSNIPLESCENVIATSMVFLTNTTIVIGGYIAPNCLKENGQISPNIFIIDLERDIVTSFLKLNGKEEKPSVGTISKLNISPDNQWLAVLTSYGNAYIINLDSLKLEADITNLENDIFESFSKNSYSTPIASLTFNNCESDIVSVVLSDGKYFFYSISLKRVFSKESSRIQMDGDNNLNLSRAHFVPRSIYSPVLHGPIVNTDWIKPPKTNLEDEKALDTGFMVLRTLEYLRYIPLLNKDLKN
ncbi:U3 small nucleolar RNA-associated protein 4 [Cryptosporidium felis]|nr:U3 small nucleolar RNA-associated protein 4 [Cryptosporidium felis]